MITGGEIYLNITKKEVETLRIELEKTEYQLNIEVYKLFN